NLTFITTTILMCVFLLRVHISKIWIVIFGVFYFTIEVVFLAGNLIKLTHGGWLTLLLASTLFTVMFAWYGARKIKNSFVRFVEDRKSTRLNSSHVKISYAVFC